MAVSDWSTTASTNATADGNINWQEGQNPSTVNNSARAMMAAVKSMHLDLCGLALGGSGDTFTLTPAQALASLSNAVVSFFADRANTGAVTLAVSGLTAKPLRHVSGTDLSANDILSGGYYVCAYDTANEEWILAGAKLLKNADLPSMANNTVKANISGSASTPSDVTIDNLINAASAGAVAYSKLPTIADKKILANFSGSTAAPAATDAQTILDDALGSTQGEIAFYDGTDWTGLGVGTADYVLKSGGAGADPSWVAGETVALPSQTSKSGAVLTTDATNASWSSDKAVTAKGNASALTTTPAIAGALNIGTPTVPSAGTVRFPFSTSMSNTNYTVTCSVVSSSIVVTQGAVTKNTAYVELTFYRIDTAAGHTPTAVDVTVHGGL